MNIRKTKLLEGPNVLRNNTNAIQLGSNVKDGKDSVLKPKWKNIKNRYTGCYTRVFDRLKNFGFALKLSKCQFFMSSVKFLGHVVGNGYVKADPDKVSAILDYAPQRIRLTCNHSWVQYNGIIVLFRTCLIYQNR